MNLPRTISPETMLTMSWISPFCKRNIRFRFHRNGDSIDVKHAIGQIRLFRRTCPPSLPSPISSYRGGVWYLKRREKERESGRRNWQTKRANGTWPLWFTKIKIKKEEKGRREETLKWKRNGDESTGEERERCS